ncbi:MAG: Crp/Fnr family transcriptional regulator [Gammaproteobacteria bacterium]|nr:DUF2281 domain-containing protein [Gammaproteobacteria bacterium]NNJ92949.1 Crp/Fnr family transcriptional regulator [Gammaproteobacteria bacterium]
MLLPNSAAGSKTQRQLIKLFSRLDKNRQQQLLDFAEFLVEKPSQGNGVDSEAAEKPVVVTRPDNESVIAAIKRLSKSYSMLNKDDILHETSDLMTSHVLKGRPAEEVIDELEILFVTHYEQKYKPSSDEEDG